MSGLSCLSLSDRVEALRRSVRYTSRSRVMEDFFSRAARFAEQSDNVWIVAENGYDNAGLARGMHEASPRRGRPFEKLSLGAVPRAIAEAEMRGNVRGTFLGATTTRAGVIERAANGTLFVDEPRYGGRTATRTLLDILADRSLTRDGAEQTPVSILARAVVVDSSQGTRRIRREHGEGRWRAVFPLVLRVPPLRERPSDIEPLIEQFLDERSKDGSAEGDGIGKKFSASALELLRAHSWPVNECELRNAVRTACVLAKGSIVSEDDVRAALVPREERVWAGVLNRALTPGFSIEAVLDEVARSYVARALRETEGNKTKAAQLLGLASYQTLSNWMNRLRMPG